MPLYDLSIINDAATASQGRYRRTGTAINSDYIYFTYLVHYMTIYSENGY